MEQEHIDTLKGIIERLREAADALESAIRSGDQEEIEGTVDEYQYMLLAAGKTMRDMI